MPQRKSIEGATPRRTKKRMPFTATRSAKTKAIILRNAKESPLLNLPLEVQRRILRHVVGDSIIYVRWIECKCLDSDGHWGTLVFNKSRDATDMDSLTLRSPLTVEHLAGPEWHGFKGSASTIGGAFPLGHLGLLATCRQIFPDAHQLFYSTNTFMFSDPLSWKKWFNGRTGFEKGLIKSLHLTLDEFTHACQEFNGNLTRRVTGSLTGLRNLRLTFNTVMGRSTYAAYQKAGLVDQLFEVNEARNTKNFAYLPLRNVEVSVWSSLSNAASPIAPPIAPPALGWTEENIREYAEMFKRRLLDQNPEQTSQDVRKKNREYCWDTVYVGENRP